jgi:hypothetical protein
MEDPAFEQNYYHNEISKLGRRLQRGDMKKGFCPERVLYMAKI